MGVVRWRGVQLRRAALVAAGALALHELRVVAGYGHDAELVMREPGHAYLPLATGLAVVLLAVAGAQFARALAGGRRGAVPARPPRSTLAVWLHTSALLAAIYLVQAGAESLFDPGHPILAHGGWSVAPLALGLGALIALATREADRALRSAAPRRLLSTRILCPVAVPGTPAPDPARPRLAPLARGLAGRAPPPRA
jgi:hypothetical protein